MKIKVEVKNELLGDSVFWEGDEADTGQIQNIIAKNLAVCVRKDGETRQRGMWVVSRVHETDET